MSRWNTLYIPKEKSGRNKGVARAAKESRRDAAIARQMDNIDRGYYLCGDWNTGCPGKTAVTLKEVGAEPFHRTHAHIPAPLKREIRNKHNQLVTVNVF